MFSRIQGWGGAGGASESPAQGRRPATISEVVAELGAVELPERLRGDIHALDHQWNRSRKAEDWVVGACLDARRGDLLEGLIDQHAATRLTCRTGGVEIVAGLLPRSLSLSQVEFSRTSIHDDHADLLAGALPRCANLARLTLDRCLISDDGLTALVGALPQMHRLETLHIAAPCGLWLSALSPSVACHATLTSLELEILDLMAGEASDLGRALQCNRFLTTLRVHTASAAAIAALLTGLSHPDRPAGEDDPLRTSEGGGSMLGIGCLDLQAHVPFDDAFCAVLCQWIQARGALKSLRIRGGIQAAPEAIERLCAAIRESVLVIDFATGEMPAPLAQLSRLHPYRQMLLPERAMHEAAQTLLRSTNPWSELPADLVGLIATTLVGRGSHQTLWGMSSVDRQVRDATVKARGEVHRARLATQPHRPGSCREVVAEDIAHFWRLQLSDMQLCPSDALLLQMRCSQLTSVAYRDTPDRRSFQTELIKEGKRLVAEHLAMARRWVDEGRVDAAAFALGPVLQLVKAHGFPNGEQAGELSQRLILGEMRYQRRNACFKVASSLCGLAFWLAMADGLADGAMRYVFDPERAYGVGSPKSFDAGRSQRGTGLGLAIGSIVTLYLLFRIADQWAVRGRTPPQPDPA